MRLIFILFITLLTACGQQGSKKTEIETAISEPENLPEYFQHLLADSANYCVSADSLESEQITRSFRLLQDFADGKTDEYPAWSVNETLGHIAFSIIRAASEGDCYDPDTVNCTACCLNHFLEAYLDQAFRLCPDITLLLPSVSDDGEIGIFNFEHFGIPYNVRAYDAPTYIVYKDAKKRYRKALWAKGDSYENIYQIGHNGKRYYLLVNLTGYFESHFSLISLEGEIIKENLEPVSEDVSRLMRDISLSEYGKETFPETEKLIFNPQELTWKECRKKKNGYWAEFPGSKTFRLLLGDKNYIKIK